MCSPAPVATRAWTDTLATWPGVTFLGIVGDQNHQTRRSSHNCAPMQESGAYDPNHAHALDVGHGGDRALAAAIRVAFLADPRVRYVIDNGTGYYPDGRTFRSTGHTTHVHVSFLPGTTFDTRPFFTDTQGGFGTMTDDEIRQEFANQDKRVRAIVQAELEGIREETQGLRKRTGLTRRIARAIAHKVGVTQAEIDSQA